MPQLRDTVAELRAGLDDRNEMMRFCRVRQQQAREDRTWCLTTADSLRLRGLQATADFVSLTADNVRTWAQTHNAAHDFAHFHLGQVEQTVFMLEAVIRYGQAVREEDLVMCSWAYLTLAYINPILDCLEIIHDAYTDIEERVHFCRQLEAEAPPLFPPLEPLLDLIDMEVVAREQLEAGAECPICLEEYDAANDIDAVIVRLPCNGHHTFHADCIGAWLDRREDEGEDITCPLDRELLL
ncbi:hypothetical protein BDV97DRAFT_366671 [Delphinella strobiligena]|nr:hypothetical protein BDV97DRAFT_366671 [Delphinella strobiligena]